VVRYIRHGTLPSSSQLPVSKMAPITHIVLFKYSSSISWTELQKHFREFTALRTSCVKPNGKPYMVSMRMGKNHSWEPYSKGITHAFILEFANADDRDYYLLKDPVHHAFSAKATPLIEDSVVVGKWMRHGLDGPLC
jgi:Stress responsive A/B Barrel Domain